MAKWIMATICGVFAIGCVSTIERAQDQHAVTTWYELCTKGGCLNGGGNWGYVNDKGAVLQERAWQEFISAPGTVAFLLTRLASTNATAVHHCGFGSCSEQRLAVYAIQHALHTNWFGSPSDFKRLRTYHCEHPSAREMVLSELLADDAARGELKEFFLAVASGRISSNERTPTPRTGVRWWGRCW